MADAKEPVKIVLETLKGQVEKGMKRKELAEYYNISEAQMANALKSAGLKIRKFHAPSFVLVTEENAQEISNPTSEVLEQEVIAESVTATEEVVAEKAEWED